MKYKVSDIADINVNGLSKKEKLDFINYLDTANLTDGLIDEIKKLIIGVDKIPNFCRYGFKRSRGSVRPRFLPSPNPSFA
jgi:hypothetical protein